MSIEQLLFFLLILAIPLLERLIQTMRSRTGNPPGDQHSAPDPGTDPVPQPEIPVPNTDTSAARMGEPEMPLPVSPVPPALPQAIPHAVRQPLRGSEREPRERLATPVPATSRRTGHSEPSLVRRHVIVAGDLRRAVMLMAILGPCRALDPNDR